MVIRRTLLALAVCAPAAGWAADDAISTIEAIYRRAAAGRGDSGGQFLWAGKRDRRAAFTRRTADLWDRAEARTAKGDAGPIEFDPVTNSQDPQLKGYTVRAEMEAADTATIVVTLKDEGRTNAADRTVRYLLLRENGRWKIDDIRGAIEGDPWSIREILAASSKR